MQWSITHKVMQHVSRGIGLHSPEPEHTALDLIQR